MDFEMIMQIVGAVLAGGCLFWSIKTFILDRIAKKYREQYCEPVTKVEIVKNSSNMD